MLYVNELLYNLKIRKYITRKLENDYSSMPIKFYDCMPKGFLSYLFAFIFYLFDAPVSVQRTLLYAIKSGSLVDNLIWLSLRYILGRVLKFADTTVIYISFPIFRRK